MNKHEAPKCLIDRVIDGVIYTLCGKRGVPISAVTAKKLETTCTTCRNSPRA